MTDYLPGSIKHLNMLLGEQLTEGEGGGGGGSSWQTVFEGNVITEADGDWSIGEIEGFSGSSADTIKVTFNGVEYTCDKISLDGNNFYGGFDEEGNPDFSSYPFGIVGSDLYTATPNTYTLKIEEPQSGGSSDFSTAEVTFSIVNTGNLASMPLVVTTESGSPFDALLPTKREVEDGAYTIALYKGKAVVGIEVGQLGDTISTSGAIEKLEDSVYLVTGDCTITIS